MAYKIEVSYQTGDSFHTEDKKTILEMKWENIENAKAALKRIQEHYAWYDHNDAYSFTYRKRKEEIKEPKWHKGLHEYTIKVKLDNDNEVTFPASWCGYFERLYGASIITVDSDLDDSTSFTV